MLLCAHLRLELGRFDGGPQGGASGHARQDALVTGKCLSRQRARIARHGDERVHEPEVHAPLEHLLGVAEQVKTGWCSA